MATITLPENEEQIENVNGFYFMANHTPFNGDPILTLQINNGENKSIKLKKKDVSTVLHYLHDNNIPFINLNSNIHPAIDVENESYRSLYNEDFYIVGSCMMFIIGFLFIRNGNNQFTLLNFQHLFGLACIIVGITLLSHPTAKIKENQLMLKGYIHKSIIALDDILKITVCSLGKGELIEVVTKDYDYYYLPIKGGRLKALINDLQQLGIDASYGNWDNANTDQDLN